MKKILIIGATSAIAEACARLWAQRGEQLFLVGRHQKRLEAINDDLKVRGASNVSTYVMDMNNIEQHELMLSEATSTLNGIDTVLIAHGTLSVQPACEQSTETTLQEIMTNGLSTIALLTIVANQFEARKHGTIAIISSVAGDRGRQSNYVYGTAKAMVSTFASGLRQRLNKSGVHVLTIKPGFVDTPMTSSFKKNALWAKPETVAKDIDSAIQSHTSTLYTPFFWRGIMCIIKMIPERIFKRLSL